MRIAIPKLEYRSCVFSFFLLLGLVSSTEVAAQLIKVTGTVTDEDQNPIEFVEVVGNEGETGAYTDEQGRYVIRLKPRDTLVVEFRSLDHQNKTVLIPLPDTPEIEQNVEMKVTAVSLGVVTVTEQFKELEEEATISIETMDSKRLDQFASTEIIDAMTMIPGVTIYDDQPSIRGSSGYTYGAGSRVLTLLNGLPMVTADRGSVNFDMLPTDNIQQIEIFKGAASVMYGTGAMGGVINVITADPADTPRTAIRTKIGFFDSPPNDTADWDGPSAAIFPSIHAFHSRRIGEHFDLSAQLDLIYKSGYRKYESSKRVRTLIMTKYRIPKVKGLSIGLNAQYLHDSTGLVIAWRDYPRGALIPGDGFISYNKLHRVSLDPSVSYVGKNYQALYQGRFFLATSSVRTGIGEDATNQDNTSLLSYHEFQFKKPFWDDRIQTVFGLNYVNSYVVSDSVYGDGTGDQLAAYLQVKFDLNRLNVVLGARYQYETIEGDTSVKRIEGVPRVSQVTMNDPIFRLGINYRAGKATYLRTSIGQALRSPSIAERFTATQAGPLQILPNPDIQVEKGWSAELGVRQLFKFNRVKGFFDIGAFTMQFENMVEFWVDTEAFLQGGGIPFTAQNVSSASIYGVELNYNFEWDITNKFNIFWNGGVTYIDPIDNNGDEVMEGDENAEFFFLLDRFGSGEKDNPPTLKYRNPWLVRTNLQLTYGPVSFTTNYSYTSHMTNVDMVFLVPQLFDGTKRFRQENNSGWHIFDFILAYRFPRNTISFHVFNAFNEEYMTIPATLGPQRNFAFQWRVEF